jgi:DNA-directed RNA polymerase subunit RPC12/RpoP
MTDDPSWLCYRGERCADARRETSTLPDGELLRNHIPATATAPGLLCRSDTMIVRTAIGKLPMDYLELATLLGKSKSVEAPVSGSREPPTPIRLGISVLADDILAELERWAEVLAESCGFWYAARGTRLDRIHYAGGWVAGLYERLLRLPATWHRRLDPTNPHVLSGRDADTCDLERGVEGAVRLFELHERTTLLAGRGRRIERMSAPCPHCHRLALEREENAANVDCRRCGERIPVKVYEKHASVLARNYERHPRARPSRPDVDPPPWLTAEGPPIVWVDESEHGRVDAGSNMMLRYLERHDARQVA